MAILANEKVLTLDFWKPANKLAIGDYVFDRNGQIVKVKLVQEYFSDSCYQVTFDDYLTASGDHKLELPVENLQYRKKLSKYKGRRQFGQQLKFIPVQDLLHLPLKSPRARSTLSVPTTSPINLPTQPLSIPPFAFGYWFVNRKAPNKLTFIGKNVEYITQKFKDAGYKVNRLTKNSRYFSLSPSIESQLVPNIPKKIPANYIMASAEQRIELLSGIVHAKYAQYNVRLDKFRVTSTHYPFVVQVQNIAESLGIKTKIESTPQLGNYTIFFKSRIKLMEHQVSPPAKIHISRRYINQISTLPAQMCVHIETDGNDNTILVGEGFIATC